MKKKIGLSFSLIILAITIKLTLYDLFPYTGLGRIGTFPICMILTLILTVIFYRNFHKFKSYTSVVYVFFIVFVFIINFSIYPQEFRPSVSEQIINYYSAYKNYDSLKWDDIYIPEQYPDFMHKNSKKSGLLERYITALHKFKDRIPYDGSYSIYLEHKQRVVYSNYKDPYLWNENDIEKKLKTEGEKLYYSILQKLK